MGFEGTMRVADLERVVKEASAEGKDEVAVELNDQTEDTPPLAVRLSVSGAHASAKFEN
jgi:hypothetical protein